MLELEPRSRYNQNSCEAQSSISQHTVDQRHDKAAKTAYIRRVLPLNGPSPFSSRVSLQTSTSSTMTTREKLLPPRTPGLEINTAEAHSQLQSPLFRLPAELRQQIYEYGTYPATPQLSHTQVIKPPFFAQSLALARFTSFSALALSLNLPSTDSPHANASHQVRGIFTTTRNSHTPPAALHPLSKLAMPYQKHPPRSLSCITIPAVPFLTFLHQK